MRVEGAARSWSATCRSSTCPRRWRARCSASSTASLRSSSCALKVAAVVGPTFSLETVSEAHPVGAGALRRRRGSGGAGRARPGRRPRDRPRALLRLPSRDHARCRLRPSDRVPTTAAAPRRRRVVRAPPLRPGARAPPRAAGPPLGAGGGCAQGDRLPRAGRAQALRGGAFQEAAQFYAELRAQAQRDGSWNVRICGSACAAEQGEAAAHYFLGDFERGRALHRGHASPAWTAPCPSSAWSLARQPGGASRARQAAHLVAPGRYRDRRLDGEGPPRRGGRLLQVLVQICYLNGESGAELST